MEQFRLRFAPSPTGFMHVGNLRTALYEYLVAKANGGQFILRIEDTDQERLVEGAVQLIYDTLKEVGLKHDEGPDIGGPYGPYIQSERRDGYKEAAEQLVQEGKAYYCFCTPDRLAKLKEKGGESFIGYDRHCRDLSPEEVQKKLDQGQPYVIRQKMPLQGTTTFHDAVYGDISVANSELEDQILIKSDGFPTYNFANVIDDHNMHITHVVRGSEYLSSTPKYNLLYEAFGFEVPTYVHLPLILGEDGHKLSKRHGATGFNDLVAEGYLPEAIINYIALLGWAPPSNQEKFSLAELEELFDVKGISKSPATFDYNKLTWFNGEYLRDMSLEEFTERCRPYFDMVFENKDYDATVLASILQPRLTKLTQIPEMIDFLVNFNKQYDPQLFVHKKMKTTLEGSRDTLMRLFPLLEEMTDWNKDDLHDLLIKTAKDWGIKNGQLMWPTRIAISGLGVTPGGAVEILYLLGKDETLLRLGHSISLLSDFIDQQPEKVD